jgi:hypothetical protein
MTLYDFLSMYIRDFERNTLFSTISDQYGRAGRCSLHWETNMITGTQCCGFGTDPDPRIHTLSTDPAPDPAIFVSDRQDGK